MGTLNVGTVPTLCTLNVGTVPTLGTLNVGTVPKFSPSLSIMMPPLRFSGNVRLNVLRNFVLLEKK